MSSTPYIRPKIRRDFYVLSGELGVSQAFLARWYIGGGYMDVCEVVVFYDCDKIYTSRTTILSLSGGESGRYF